ncbi:MAG TPA: GH3 auxin-responsive promoter family protein [Cyclobacteriaceae bacterium]|jgi:hypothetical protein
MPLVGNLLQKGIRIRESLDQEYSSPIDLQKTELKKLLITASATSFGKTYDFKEILQSFRSRERQMFYNVFKSKVPYHNYDKMFEVWWYKCLKGEKNVCWPGRVKYFALSSGTSGAPSKHIPITDEMSKAIRKTSLRQILTLSRYDLPAQLFEKGILMVGGSISLNYNGTYFEGDLSGIQASQLPFWFQHFYKPGKKIAKNPNWTEKLEEITRKAPEWDIGIIVGVPAWIQILMEKIINHYKVKNIHEIWPNLMIYVHGGVFFEPYRKGFERLLAKPISYIETYLASEGFLAFQALPHRKSMRLVLNNGIFYEFVPFTDRNFTTEGELREDHEAMMIDDVKENTDYAVLLSTCAGAWRYLIGDTIQFVSVEESEIRITGRTKHYLSLCGEHLSVDNMNHAIKIISNELDIEIKEFSVAGVPVGSLFGHHWFIGCDDPVKSDVLAKRLDEVLKELNDDYKVERNAALKSVEFEILPSAFFYNWLKTQGKEGGQNKFPRVLNKSSYNSWTMYLQNEKVRR